MKQLEHLFKLTHIKYGIKFENIELSWGIWEKRVVRTY